MVRPQGEGTEAQSPANGQPHMQVAQAWHETPTQTIEWQERAEHTSSQLVWQAADQVRIGCPPEVIGGRETVAGSTSSPL